MEIRVTQAKGKGQSTLALALVMRSGWRLHRMIRRAAEAERHGQKVLVEVASEARTIMASGSPMLPIIPLHHCLPTQAHREGALLT